MSIAIRWVSPPSTRRPGGAELSKSAFEDPLGDKDLGEMTVMYVGILEDHGPTIVSPIALRSTSTRTKR
eukprot:9451799-Ditylum_brightwellii.AAC.1